MGDALRVAIASDLHTSATPNNDSWAVSSETRKGYNPLVGLLDLVDDPAIAADILLLPGDLTNRGDETELGVAWSRAQELGTALGAGHVVATPGNHDLKSHTPGITDVTVAARALTPSFPTLEPARDAEFWSEGLCVVEGDDWQIVVVNSCVEHYPQPPSTATQEELDAHAELVDRGSFTQALEEQLKDVIRNTTTAVNILVCHHHPLEHEHEPLFADSYGPMKSGQRLLACLREDTSNHWLLVHGHKHAPRFLHDAGGTAAPFILGAGSTGAQIWSPLHTVARNQFHLLEVSDYRDSRRLGLRGAVQTWFWGYGIGWRPAPREGTGLPGFCGFGTSLSGEVLADAIRAKMDTDGPVISATDLPTDVFQLLPDDLARLESQLRARQIALLSVENRIIHATEVP